MEAVNPWLSLVGVVVPALVGSLLLYRSSRKDSDKTGEGGFRDDLLQRIDQQDRRIAALELGVQERDVTIDQLRREVSDVRDDNRRLRDLSSDQLAHITVLTDWGINAQGDPPRTPPHWRQVQ